MAEIMKRPVRHFPGGRISKNITLGPRAKILVERAAEAACTTHSAVIERLILNHCPELIKKEEEVLALR